MQLIDRLLWRKAEREATADERFEKLVLELADGASPVEEDVETILDATGKSPHDLGAAVDFEKEKRRLREAKDELASELADLNDRKPRLVDRQRTLVQQRAEEMKRRDADIDAVTMELDEVKDRIQQLRKETD